jgi:hypothetical protein
MGIQPGPRITSKCLLKKQRRDTQVEAKRRRRRRTKERKQSSPYHFKPDNLRSNTNALTQWEELENPINTLSQWEELEPSIWGESNEGTSGVVDPPPLMSIKIDPSVVTCMIPCLVSGSILEAGYTVGTFPKVPSHLSVLEAWPEVSPQVSDPSTANFTAPAPSAASTPAVTTVPGIFEFHISRPCPLCPRRSFFALDT